MLTFHQIGYMGRLGNQMFQFAAIVAIGKRKGLPACFPIENCIRGNISHEIDPNTGKQLILKCDLLDCFDIDPGFFIPYNHLGINKVYQETLFEYDPSVERIEDNTTLVGYFQTEKYFMEYRDFILSQFRFKDEYLYSASRYIESIRSNIGDSKICSIHVRRGDYLNSPNHHPTCTKEYYQKATEKMKEDFPNLKFLIFSDDPQWCIDEFVGDEYVVSPLRNPYSELCAMSLCDHHIIANSSFSWWGAWLNKNSNKKVIAPSRWFGPMLSNKNTHDIYCKDWEII